MLWLQDFPIVAKTRKPKIIILYIVHFLHNVLNVKQPYEYRILWLPSSCKEASCSAVHTWTYKQQTFLYDVETG